MRSNIFTHFVGDKSVFASRAIVVEMRANSNSDPLRLMQMFTGDYCAGSSLGTVSERSSESTIQSLQRSDLQHGVDARLVNENPQTQANRSGRRWNILLSVDSQSSVACGIVNLTSAWQQSPSMAPTTNLGIAV
ncbi:MAG TPA: hypothetical protein PKD64_12700 [Pirellulaceae bacterium]|nr:hypothetical protein [Pirellulaceae bacterium]HMO93047.1 hypothetical protein [Pirellulaceae bacterium]HMP69677.1 hypothetical protein [Pirellulaceae bacterium]